MASLLPNGRQYYPKSDGTPLVGGKVYTYAVGTTTPKATFTDAAGLVPNTNPVILDARGEALIFWQGSYRIIVTDADDVAIWVVDDVSGVDTTFGMPGGAGLIGAEDGAGGTLWSNVQSAINYLKAWIQTGVGTVTRTVRLRLGDYATFEDFLPTTYNPATNDASAAIVTAATWSATNRKPVHFNSRYRLSNCATINAQNKVQFVFNAPWFEIADNGAAGTITNGASGKIGILFKLCQDLSITGQANFVGLGTLGTTSLMGMVLDSCPRARVPAHMHFENMAGGRSVFWCDDGYIGDISGRNIAGLATFEVPPTDPQGTLEDIAGCRRTKFGNAVCEGHILPARYLSVLFDSSGAAIDNEDCSFGSVSGRGTGTTAQAFAVRSAVRCAAGNIAGSGWSEPFNVFISAGDTGWNVDRLTVGDIAVAVSSTLNTNAAVKAISAEPTKSIGKISVGNVTASGASGAEHTVIVNSGAVEITSVNSSGFLRPIYAFDVCGVKIGSLTVANQAAETVYFGRGAKIEIGSVEIETGPSSVTTAAIRYDPDIGSGSFVGPQIDRIKYRQGAASNNYLYITMDLTNGFQSWYVGNIDGSGSSAPARFANDEYRIIGGQIYSTAPPTSGAYTLPASLRKSNTAAGGSNGWELTTAGTPGVWKAWPAVAV